MFPLAEVECDMAEALLEGDVVKAAFDAHVLWRRRSHRALRAAICAAAQKRGCVRPQYAAALLKVLASDFRLWEAVADAVATAVEALAGSPRAPRLAAADGTVVKRPVDLLRRGAPESVDPLALALAYAARPPTSEEVLAAATSGPDDATRAVRAYLAAERLLPRDARPALFASAMAADADSATVHEDVVVDADIRRVSAAMREEQDRVTAAEKSKQASDFLDCAVGADYGVAALWTYVQKSSASTAS